jgi:hypothetical protein
VRRLISTDHRRALPRDVAARAGTPGIARARLAPRFRSWSDVDLRTAAGHYLFRRPR